MAISSLKLPRYLRRSSVRSRIGSMAYAARATLRRPGVTVLRSMKHPVGRSRSSPKTLRSSFGSGSRSLALMEPRNHGQTHTKRRNPVLGTTVGLPPPHTPVGKHPPMQKSRRTKKNTSITPTTSRTTPVAFTALLVWIDVEETTDTEA